MIGWFKKSTPRTYSHLKFESQEFRSFEDRNSCALFEDIEFRRCTLSNCVISWADEPSKRSTVRNVRLIQCQAPNTYLFSAIVEDSLVDGLKTRNDFATFGAVFKHVVLRGRIDYAIINTNADIRHPGSQKELAFAQANAEYYADVDWALDISEAQFASIDIRGIPARLIRRDPATQVVVTRDKARAAAWRNLDLEDTHWPIALGDLITGDTPDTVLVAPRRARNFGKLVEGLRRLQDAGVAEPD